MTRTETAQMLHVFQDYWPTFAPRSAEHGLPGTVDAWSEALRDYPIDECRRALMVLRGQADRTFAPTISEFEGLLREFAEEHSRARRALAAPKSGDAEGTELCSYEAGPKQKDGSWTKHTAIRCTPAGRREMLAWYERVRATKVRPGKVPAPFSRPVLDESYDWAAAFKRLADVKKLPQTDYAIPEAPKKAKAA